MTTAQSRVRSRERLTRRTLICQALGFGLVIVVLWIDEVWDLPHYLLGAERTPINWRESILESVVVAIIGGQTFAWMDEALGRIRHLAGLLVVCAHCRKIRVSGQWVALEQFLRDHSEAEYAHSLCPECDETLYGDQVRQRQSCAAEPSVGVKGEGANGLTVSNVSPDTRGQKMDGRVDADDKGQPA